MADLSTIKIPVTTTPSLRDYFAARAMQAVCSWEIRYVKEETVPQVIARLAYELADAMLSVREKTNAA